ncbi:MAG: putative rane protein [Deltaproteobacteria bacterium]|nr:putative rane protein [Deltaproteobacteria bacterium]
MIDSVVFYYAPDSEDMGIDGEQMKELTDAFNTELVTVLKDSYSIVAEPGPDAARLRIALTHIKKSKPVVSTVTSIIPVGIVISVIKRGTTGSWTGSGATSAEFILGSYIMNRRTFLTLLGVSWGMHRTGTLATLLATHSSNT